MARDTDFTKEAARFIAAYIDKMKQPNMPALDDDILTNDLKIGKLLHDAIVAENTVDVFPEYDESQGMTMAEFLGETPDPMLKTQYSGDTTYELVLRGMKESGVIITSNTLIDYGLDANQMITLRKLADQLIDVTPEIKHLPKPKPWEKTFFSKHFLDHKIQLIKNKHLDFALLLDLTEKLGSTASVEFDFYENNFTIAATQEQCASIKEQVPYHCEFDKEGLDSILLFPKAAGNAEAIINRLANIEIKGEKLISHLEKQTFIEQFRENCPPNLQRTK